MAVELGDEANIGAFVPARIQLLGKRNHHGTEHLAKIGHTTSRLYLCEYRLPSGFDLRYTIPKDGSQQVRLRAEVILQPGHVLLPGRQVELAQGDAVDAAFGEQAFGGQDQPVATVPCIASKRLSLHETD